MKAWYLLPFVVFGLYSCDLTATQSTPDRVDQLSDSLWSVYGKEIKIPKPEYLKVLGTAPNGNTILSGGRGMEFWLGIFSPDRSLIKDHTLTDWLVGRRLETEDDFKLEFGSDSHSGIYLRQRKPIFENLKSCSHST